MCDGSGAGSRATIDRVARGGPIGGGDARWIGFHLVGGAAWGGGGVARAQLSLTQASTAAGRGAARAASTRRMTWRGNHAWTGDAGAAAAISGSGPIAGHVSQSAGAVGGAERSTVGNAAAG